VTYDRLGTGLSDPVDGELTLERQTDDLIAVLDAAGCSAPAFVGLSEAGRLGVFAAAAHPERLSALVLVGTSVASSPTWSPDRRQQLEQLIEAAWGSGQLAALYTPSLAGDARFMRFLARYERNATSRGMARRLLELSASIDLRPFLSSVRVPTLVLHRRQDTLIPIERGRELADSISGARFVELDGIDNSIVGGDTDAAVDEIEEFLTGQREANDITTTLATVLFTDIVDSTAHAARLGDRGWADLLAAHDAIVRRALSRYRGEEVKTLGDGFLAVFDGPARAIRCAHELQAELRRIGLIARAGLHAGEVQRTRGDIHGLAVNIAARVGALAGPDELLVTSTVADLVVGSGLQFAEHSVRELKGVPGTWRLLRVAP
jgi:class 3 adenylate cyclase